MIPSPVRLERLARGLSQLDVAKALHCDQTSVSLVERGWRLDGPTFLALADFYGVFVGALRGQMLSWRRQVGHPTSPRVQPPGKVRAA